MQRAQACLAFTERHVDGGRSERWDRASQARRRGKNGSGWPRAAVQGRVRQLEASLAAMAPRQEADKHLARPFATREVRCAELYSRRKGWQQTAI